MKLSDLPIPEIYLESNDFRFFLKWFEAALTRLNYDTENVLDLYDPQRCPEHLLWMLADTMGYKYDDRLSSAFCRLVLLYFMSMIRYKGSKSGVTLAAEVNLAQFNLIEYGKEKDILKNRLEDTSIPINSVYVTAHTPEGFIDVVYFSDKKPIDACIEYVRPLGMYCFQHAGVKFDGRTKISIDARLTNINDAASGEGITRVGHYSRNDYARMQRMSKERKTKKTSGGTTTFNGPTVSKRDQRQLAWKRNRVAEGEPSQNAGYRALYSLQMCNNEHITKSLLGPIFNLQYGPQDVVVHGREGIADTDPPRWNLAYNKTIDESITSRNASGDFDVYTMDGNVGVSTVPAVNPIMAEIGDAISLNQSNTYYTKYDDQTGTISTVPRTTTEEVMEIVDLSQPVTRTFSPKDYTEASKDELESILDNYD